jgi:peptide/nickel transport system ATP-binding protein
MSAAPLLAIANLSVSNVSVPTARAPARPILRDVSLTVAAGEVHGLVGESGAGKSTIARAVLGMIAPSLRVTGGAIALSGVDLLALAPDRRRRLLGAEVALIPQDPLTALNPSRRVAAQITDGLRLWKGLSASEARDRALALLAEVHMRDPERVMACYPHELSGGMRQRVLIAAAFAMEPKLIIADEPTTALDVTVQKQILRLLRAMQAHHGTGVVFVTHDLGVVAQICDRVTLLFQGKVMEQGTTAAMLGEPRHAYTRALVGATPRYDRPEAGLIPIPEDVAIACRAEIARFDAARARHG